MVELTLTAYAEYASAMPADVFHHYMQNIRETLEQDDRGELWIATDGGAIAASTLVYAPGTKLYGDLPEGSPYPEVRLLAVHPLHRGRGLARSLMHSCVELSQQRGHAGLTLHTSDLMVAAQALYASLGFERYKEADFWPDPDLCVKGYRLLFRA